MILFFSYYDTDTQIGKRNTLISSVLNSSAKTLFHTSFVAGYETNWIGISRFEVDNQIKEFSHTVNQSSEDNWTISGGDYSFESDGIHISNTGTSVSLRLNLFSQGNVHFSPYFFPQISNKISVNWEGNINSITVKLVTAEDEEIELGSIQGTYDIPRILDEYYAGSHLRKFNGTLTNNIDEGIDIEPNGVSDDVNNSIERNIGYQLGFGKQYRYLKYEISCDTNSEFTIIYPTFISNPKRTRIYHEASNSSFLIMENGSGVRFGTLRMRKSPSIPPFEIRQTHERCTVLDWLVFRNLVLLGAFWGDNYNSSLSNYFDFLEEYTEEDDFLEDTYSLMIQTTLEGNPLDDYATGLLVNGLREVPPLCNFPRRKRDKYLTDVISNEQVQYSYDLSTNRRYLCNPKSHIEYYRVLYEDETEVSREKVSNELVTIDNWGVSYYNIVLNNDEVINKWDGTLVTDKKFIIVKDGTDYIQCSPFHGYFFVIPSEQEELGKEYILRFGLDFRNPFSVPTKTKYIDEEYKSRHFNLLMYKGIEGIIETKEVDTSVNYLVSHELSLERFEFREMFGIDYMYDSYVNNVEFYDAELSSGGTNLDHRLGHKELYTASLRKSDNTIFLERFINTNQRGYLSTELNVYNIEIDSVDKKNTYPMLELFQYNGEVFVCLVYHSKIDGVYNSFVVITDSRDFMNNRYVFNFKDIFGEGEYKYPYVSKNAGELIVTTNKTSNEIAIVVLNKFSMGLTYSLGIIDPIIEIERFYVPTITINGTHYISIPQKDPVKNVVYAGNILGTMIKVMEI